MKENAIALIEEMAELYGQKNGSRISPTTLYKKYNASSQITTVMRFLGFFKKSGTRYIWNNNYRVNQELFDTIDIALKEYRDEHSGENNSSYGKKETKKGLLIEEIPIGELTNSQIVDYLRERGVEVNAWEKKEL